MVNFLNKLHLGCGSNYLMGYTNVDYPQDYTIQNRQRMPDIEIDFTKIELPRAYFEEIRLHHVFEHFQRTQAIALLCQWNEALKNDGLLVLAMPDINKCISEYSTANKSRKKQLLRHMWGSHEAFWATHHEGYDPEIVAELLAATGYKLKTCDRFDEQWPQFVIVSERIKDYDLDSVAAYLQDMTVLGDREVLLRCWMQQIRDYINDRKLSI